jgi:hypothetical protein
MNLLGQGFVHMYAILRDQLRQRGWNLTWDNFDTISLIIGKILQEMAKEVNKLGGEA